MHPAETRRLSQDRRPSHARQCDSARPLWQLGLPTWRDIHVQHQTLTMDDQVTLGGLKTVH